MNDLDEIKSLIRLHIATQSVNQRQFLAVLDDVRVESGSGPGSWVGEWTRLGEHLLARDKLADAVQAFNFARFPCVDGPARRVAFERCLAAFDEFRKTACPEARRETVECAGLQIPVYVRGAPGPGVPLVIVMGGIVSLKEQWYRTLIDGPKLGFAVAVADFPGVGENGLRFDPGAEAYLTSIIDHFGRDTAELAAIVVGISFSGQLALRAAARDPRIRGVVTAGAPLRHFFTDRAWFRCVPHTTRVTLEHVCAVPPRELFERLAPHALSEQELASIDVPVRAIVSLQDDIIPPADARYLERHVRTLKVLKLDDIHGAPHFVGAVRKYIAQSLVEIGFPRRRVLARVLGALVRIELWKALLRLFFQRAFARPGHASAPRLGASGDLASGAATSNVRRVIIEHRGRS